MRVLGLAKETRVRLVPKHNGLVYRKHNNAIFFSNLTSSVFHAFVSLLQCLLRFEQRGETY